MRPPKKFQAKIQVTNTLNWHPQYTNIPDSLQPEMPDMLAKGSLREIILSIDGIVAGYAFPYPVIFSGGIVPTAWRPMIAYGAYDQPTYHIDITPLLPVLSGRTAQFAIGVAGQGNGAKRSINNNWFVSGNVKVWKGKRPIFGTILRYINRPIEQTSVVHVTSARNSAEVLTTARRYFEVTADVNGKRVGFRQDLRYLNRQTLAARGRKQHVEQLITGNVTTATYSGNISHDHWSFPLHVKADYSSEHRFAANIQLGYHRKSPHGQTDVAQEAGGEVYINEIGRVDNGTGHSRGRLSYRGLDGRRYERHVATQDIQVLKDAEREWRYTL